MTTQARELAKIVNNAGDLFFVDDVALASDGAVLNFGADNDVTLTHVADTGLLINSTRQLQFGDSGTYIHQSADGVLDLVSDTEIELNATTLDINANVDISGTLTVAGVLDFGDAAISNVGEIQLDSIAGDGDTNTSITFSGSDVITVATGGTTALTVDASQNVGIGTSTPATILDIFGTDPNDNVNRVVNIADDRAMAADVGGGISFFGKYQGSSYSTFGQIIGAKTNATSGDYSGYLAFKTRSDSALPSERMRIDSSGRVLIGTTNEYNAEADNLIIFDSGNAGLTIATGSTSGNNTIHFADGTSGDAQYRGVIEYEHNDDSMRFKVNGEQEAVRIDSSGNVGIGATSSLQKLSVQATGATVAEFLGESGPHGLRIYGNDGGFGAIGHVSTGSYDMMIDSSGRFGFGALGAASSAQFMRIEAEFSSNRIMRMANRDNGGSANTFEVGHCDNNQGAHVIIAYHGNNVSGASGDPYNDAIMSLQVNGNMAIDGTLSEGSDRRLKKDIANSTYGLAAINQLIPRTYKHRDVSKEMVGTQIGFIADEVESVIPEVVSKFGLKADGSTLPKNITGYGDEAGTEETFDNVKTLNYERLVVVLTKALQEADDKIEALTARIETLEGGE